MRPWRDGRPMFGANHGDPLAGEACVLWCVAIDRAVREARLDGIRDGLDLLPKQSRQRWTAWLDRARPPLLRVHP